MRRSIHVMLYQDAVLEHGYLRPVAVLPDDHDPLHRLAPGQELGLGDDRRAAAPGVTALPASLPLGFEPRRPLDGLDARRAVGACRAHVNHRVRRVVGLWRRGLRIRSAAPTAAPAPCRWLCLGRACRLLGGNRAADGGRVSAGPGLALRAACLGPCRGLGPGFVVGASRDSPALAAPAAATAPPAAGARPGLVLAVPGIARRFITAGCGGREGPGSRARGGRAARHGLIARGAGNGRRCDLRRLEDNQWRLERRRDSGRPVLPCGERHRNRAGRAGRPGRARPGPPRILGLLSRRTRRADNRTGPAEQAKSRAAACLSRAAGCAGAWAGTVAGPRGGGAGAGPRGGLAGTGPRGGLAAAGTARTAGPGWSLAQSA